MAMRQHFTCVLLFVYLFCQVFVHAQINTTSDLKDIADNLVVKIKVLENLDDGSLHTFQLTLTNNASTSLSGTNWKLYFYSFFIVESKNILSSDGLSTEPAGYILPEANLKILHENGCLFSFSPTADFEPIFPSGVRVVNFDAQNWAVSKTDVPPNWYIVIDGLNDAKTIKSTKQDFVEDFTTPKQWKRMKKDEYIPYTTQKRYQRYQRSSSSVQPKIVVPTPKSITRHDQSESFSLSPCVKVVEDGLGGLDDEKNFLNEILNVTSDCASAEIHLSFNNSIVVSNEGYELISDPSTKTITIQGKTNTGIFYGIQTLLSLVANSVMVPKIEIRDEPRFTYRGMHVDIARNFMQKSTMLKFIDGMAMYKLNKLHLHLTDDEGWRLEINGLPELTRIGANRCHSFQPDTCLISQLGSGPDNTTTGSGYLSIQDYKEVLMYAKARYIEVIPEIDMPGHARAAIMAMEARFREYNNSGNPQEANKYRLTDPDDTSRYLSVQNFNDNAMDPCLDSTYEFVKKVVEEIKKMHEEAQHPLNIFHFGGDEVARTAWVNSTACQGMNIPGDSARRRAALKKYFTEKVANITYGFGLNMAGWEDGFNAGNGMPFSRQNYQNDELYSNAWDNVWEWGESRRAYNFANNNYKVIMSHATHLYFDHPYEPDPEERGLYWATRFADSYKTFGFMPDKLYENIDVTRMGEPLSKSDVCGNNNKTRCPDLLEPQNIVGMQGHIWSETVLKEEYFYHMLFPRLLALAERAWHEAPWENVKDKSTRDQQRDQDWDTFAAAVGHRELKRLDDIGITYRVPPPGAKKVGKRMEVNTAFPGLTVEYSTDKNTWKSAMDIPVSEPNLYFRTRSADGRRTSRVVKFTEAGPTGCATFVSLSFLLYLLCFIFMSLFS